MSDRMSLDHAKAVATGYAAAMVNEVRAARTIVAVGEVLDQVRADADHERVIWEQTGSDYAGGKMDALEGLAHQLAAALGESP